jgi:hypothetical protein
LTDERNTHIDSEEEVEIQSVEISPDPVGDNFWMEFGKDTVKETVTGMDEKAKYMITTCASLIVIHFGLLLGLEVHDLSVKVTPEFFFVIAAALFAFSLYPIARSINLQSPDSIKNAYDIWIKWRLLGHRIAFGFFIAGLLALAITAMIGDSPK